jgi:flavorubredoxin
MENKIEVKQLSDRIYAMNDEGATGYLVLGNEKALVIDTMNASDDLGAVVRGITDLPVMVVNTHGHGDHICGNIFFEEAYIHPDDLALAIEFSNYPEFVEELEKHGLSMPPFKEILEGTVIDLGGATVEVMLLPGHTKGGICLLYREERVLFTGDGINCHLWMQLDHSLQMKELKKSLENISWVRKRQTRFFMVTPWSIMISLCLMSYTREYATWQNIRNFLKPIRIITGLAVLPSSMCLVRAK